MILSDYDFIPIYYLNYELIAIICKLCGKRSSAINRPMHTTECKNYVPISENVNLWPLYMNITPTGKKNETNFI